LRNTVDTAKLGEPMDAEDKRDVTMLVAIAELHGRPATAWDAHAALLRARELVTAYAASDHPERTAESVARRITDPNDKKPTT